MRSGDISILAGRWRPRLIALALFLSLNGALPVQAGVLSSALENEIADKRLDDPVKVLVLLPRDDSAAFLDASLEREGATRRDRHEKVVRTLQENAARTQAPLLRELDTLRQRGEVLGYTPYWIVNGISVIGTVEAIRKLEARSDVEIIEPDVRTHLIAPTNDGVGGGSLRSIGISPGLLAIEAPRVWNELGVIGYGALVANMDSGVDGEHPALQSRWRGNIAPVDQCWRDAAAWGDVEPFDRIKHGTHVMGTICGLAPDDTIGVAPGALWIADNTINQGGGTDFDNDVISGLQWFADPDGNPNTLIDVPDVVMHSWGVDESDSFYVDCDTRWWAAIDNCELAGVVQVWAAGNNGPDSSTVESPADRATNPRNAFSVGATEQFSPFSVSSFSSRGPSGCGGPDSTKPEVVAPGETIYSAVPGNGYQQLSGTSMAGPHVAGIVALMRSANPNLGVNAIKNTLMNTALDLGDPGDDNASGRGFVNAYNAVQSVIATYGRVEGVVTDLVSGLPLPGARVEVFNDTRFTIADAAGFYRMPLPPGGRVLEVSAPGYATESVFVQIVTGQPFDGSAALALAATSSITGFVRDSANAPVEGATVKALGTSFATAVSLGDGSYTLALPTGDSYTLQARKNGLGNDVETVALAGALAQDFDLPPLTAEDFESGDFLQWPWVAGGTLPWTVDAQEQREGAFSARSGSIDDSESSTMEITLSFVDGGDVGFWYRLSSQPGSDFLRFSIDGTEVASWSGLHVWTLATFSVGPGSHDFEWTYSKNSLISQGADAAWIDLVTFPTIGVPPPPDVAVAPESLLVYVTPGATADVPLSLENLGIVDLNYAIAVLPDLPRPERGEREAESSTSARRELPTKGEPDLRRGTPPLRGDGGPDAFGHTWSDSNEPDGPIYNWVEINQVGTRILPMNDDTFSGPKQIGFTFPYYGLPYSSVRVSANGFLGFSSVPGSYWLNLAIPDTTNPDNLIAAYWDDLNPLESGAVYTYQDPANERFIVEWDDVSIHGSGGAQRETFQVHLYQNGIILTQYRSVTADTSHTVGIEGPGGVDGLQVVMNAPYVQNQKAIRFSPHPAVTWLEVAPTAGTVAAAGNTSLNAHFDSASLAEGTYQAVIRIVSNDPDESVLAIPVTMIVSSMTGVEGITHTPREIALSSPWPNPVPSGMPVTVRFAVPPGEKSVTLSLYDVRGRRVRTLVDENAGLPGFRETTWDRRDDGQRAVSPGIYFVRLEVGDEERVAKVVVLR